MEHNIELDIQVNNFNFILGQLRSGANAKRYGHEMSDADKQNYAGARDIVKHLLAKDYENTNDDELIVGMEQYIATYTETINAGNNLH